MRKIGKKKRMIVPGKWLVGLAFILLIGLAAGKDLRRGDTSLGLAVRNGLTEEFAELLYDQFLPLLSMEPGEAGMEQLAQRGMESLMPLYGMARRETGAVEDASKKGVLKFEDISRIYEKEWAAGRAFAGEEPEQVQSAEGSLAKIPPAEKLPEEERDIQTLLQEENAAAMATMVTEQSTPRGKRMEVDLEELEDYETLVKTFYTIDTNTMAGGDQLEVNRLLERDMRIDRTVDGPQILIYHTHSKEGFADSTAGDDMTGILGVGEYLAEVLRTEYGYQVMHYMGQYDADGRDNAYGRALPDIERVLAENPTIQVVIDLHRDQMPEESRLVMNLDGKPTARFMFFNGLSRTRKTGDIAYLKNEYIEDNLAFSFQMELAAMEYYPGLTRKIYLKGYRYNMHVCPKTLLVELGAQNNTLEEAINACGPLAHLLDIVIGGE